VFPLTIPLFTTPSKVTVPSAVIVESLEPDPKLILRATIGSVISPQPRVRSAVPLIGNEIVPTKVKVFPVVFISRL
jgi:hypothetical protein